jgi:hypothetical protein
VSRQRFASRSAAGGSQRVSDIRREIKIAQGTTLQKQEIALLGRARAMIAYALPTKL